MNTVDAVKYLNLIRDSLSKAEDTDVYVEDTQVLIEALEEGIKALNATMYYRGH